MTPAARVSAAIEILGFLAARSRPAADILKEWGLSHRFAGSGDRAAIAGLVYDALRKRASAAWVMGSDQPRALLIGALRVMRRMDVDAIATLCSGEGFAPGKLSQEERARLSRASLKDAPDPIRGDYPEWLAEAFTEAFGDKAAEEGAALAARAPLDLRVNSLKGSRSRALEELAHLSAKPAPYAPTGIRIELAEGPRPPAVQAEPSFVKGFIEVQDEGSQLVSLLADARPGMQVLDYCAGGGGKSLALAAMMANGGQIYAADSDIRRLAPIHERLQRAGARNVQVRTPKGRVMPLDDLVGLMDLVVVDAPCTGTGTWRRNPDAKWRMRPGALEQRLKEQIQILDDAARFVKPGGRLVYITCSVLNAENGAQVAEFLGRTPGFAVVPPAELAERAGLAELAEFQDISGQGFLFTPLRTATDGFFMAGMTRAG